MKTIFIIKFIIKIILPIVTVILFFAGVAEFVNGKDDTGITLLLGAAISCFIMIAFFELCDGSYGMAVAMGFVSLLFACLMVHNIQCRVQPSVTDIHLMATAHPEGPYEVTDRHMYCSPVDDTHTFHCVGWEITRYTRCTRCGRRFRDHYSEIISLKKWQAEICRQRAQREAWANTL